MTTTRDRQRDLDVDFDGAAWDERSAIGSLRGWPWWAAVLLAVGLSLVGAVVDMKLEKSLAMLFDAAYFIGCVGAVVLVRRRNLFGPMVQSPLVLAVVVPLTVVMTTGLGSGSKSAKLIGIAEPLLKAFPLMAITTGAVVLVGAIRYLTQRRPADATADGGAARRKHPADRGDRGERGEPVRRGRAAEGGRSGQGRATANRSVAPERRERGSSSRERGSGGQDSASGRGRGGDPARGRSGSSADRGDRPRGERGDRNERSDRGDRGDRGGRGAAPRGGQPARRPRDDARRQPPRRRDDDY